MEVRGAVQSGENVILAGEEFPVGKKVITRGDMVDFRTMSVLAALGIKTVPLIDLKISILSTGDEIVPVETDPLTPGKIRDVNGWSVRSLLSRYGFESEYRGILSDEGDLFEKTVNDEAARCDVLILSGGSSVGTRDHCSRVLEKLSAPGLMVRGINIVPGKPTLIAGSLEEKTCRQPSRAPSFMFYRSFRSAHTIAAETDRCIRHRVWDKNNAANFEGHYSKDRTGRVYPMQDNTGRKN